MAADDDARLAALREAVYGRRGSTVGPAAEELAALERARAFAAARAEASGASEQGAGPDLGASVAVAEQAASPADGAGGAASGAPRPAGVPGGDARSRGRLGRALRRHPQALALAGAAALVLAVAVVAWAAGVRTVTAQPTGLDVFERPQEPADLAGAHPAYADPADESFRLLDDVLGWSFFAARTDEGAVCLARSAPDQAVPYAIRCTDEAAFRAEGVVDWLRVDEVPPAERPEGMTYRDAVEVRWAPGTTLTWTLVPATEAERRQRIGVGVIPVP
ncbi:hypothetical protein [Agromyces sp. SYSU T00194]|uniref:hypothetical protein n=1 Tax=Agromyces chitinivorans TaxID=3158560 RepID=UPI00339B3D0E